VSRWWPIAYALQRVNNKSAADPLAALATADGVYTRAFALRGLAGLGDARAVEPAMAALKNADADVKLRSAAIRALVQLRHREAVPLLASLASARQTPRSLVLESLDALGAIGDPASFNLAIDFMTSPAPTVRIAAMSAAARIDAEGFVLALSGTPRDADWTVRAGLAGVLARLPAETSRAALEELASDSDVRVQAPALRALAQAGSDDLDRRIFAALNAPDFALRAAAAELIGRRKPADAAARLAAAYARGESDAAPDARMAAINAIAAYDGPDVSATLTKALADREWPVRVRAAQLLRTKGNSAAQPERPAPLRQPPTFFESERLLRPPYSPQAYLETPAGTIQIELDVINAPLTSWSFMELARAGFFNGIRIHRLIPNFVIQAGDPRGDGEGGPGYTLRDEFSVRPYVRGTVGMALAGPETGGSQFFIALSPQPHLDARYTVFGRVVRGLDILDRISLGDVITRVTIVDQ
jgi:cyclophilin family peptidyl-prolyl cis-trans isomerase/HEAT repeat protein